jgi:hypothetical protein
MVDILVAIKNPKLYFTPLYYIPNYLLFLGNAIGFPQNNEEDTY